MHLLNDDMAHIILKEMKNIVLLFAVQAKSRFTRPKETSPKHRSTTLYPSHYETTPAFFVIHQQGLLYTLQNSFNICITGKKEKLKSWRRQLVPPPSCHRFALHWEKEIQNGLYLYNQLPIKHAVTATLSTTTGLENLHYPISQGERKELIVSILIVKNLRCITGL